MSFNFSRSRRPRDLESSGASSSAITKHSDGTADLQALAVSTAKEVLHTIGTASVVQKVATLACRILDIAEEVETNKHECQRLGRHAEKIVVALARTQAAHGDDEDRELQRDLQDLIQTMTEVLDFVEETRTAGAMTRILRKDRMLEIIKDLDKKLDESFRIFLMTSSVIMRQSQRDIAQQLEALRLSLTPSGTPYPSATVIEHPVVRSLPEGVYHFTNAATHRVVEVGDKRDVHLVPSADFTTRRQLWALSSKPGHPQRYFIRSLFNGLSLDIRLVHKPEDGSQFIVWEPHGQDNQTFEFLQRGAKSSTYLIRTPYGGTFLDTKCLEREGCTVLHCNIYDPLAVSQEWSLTLCVPWTPLPPEVKYYPPLLIRNKRTGCFMTQQGTTFGTPNIVGLADPSPESGWGFMYNDTDVHKFFFMISSVHGTALDHWGQRFPNSSQLIRDDSHLRWDVIPYHDGTVLFRNRASGKLLCHSKVGGTVDVANLSNFDNPMCQWQVTDPDDRSTSHSLVYDPLLTLCSPALVLCDKRSEPSSTGKQQKASSSVSLSPQWSPRIDAPELEAVIEEESELYKQLAHGDCNSFVIAPQEIDAANDSKHYRLRGMGGLDFFRRPYPTDRCTL